MLSFVLHLKFSSEKDAYIPRILRGYKPLLMHSKYHAGILLVLL